MRHKGRITNWNDERGFGFVLPDDGSERVFLHIKAFEQGHQRPAGDERVTYDLSCDERNRPQASRVVYVGRARTGRPVPDREVTVSGEIVPAALAALGFLVFAGVMGFMGRVPLWVPGLYAAVSVITFGAYHADKGKAVRGEWRTPESTLHLLEFAGGWPGALIAQQALRHKNRKPAFLVPFWGIVITHIAVWIWVLSQNPFAMPTLTPVKTTKAEQVPSASASASVPASRGRAAERHR